jgi:hypothetical protein
MKSIIAAIALSAPLLTTAIAHDMNGGSWQLDEDLSKNQADLKPQQHDQLNDYAMTDAMSFVKHHPNWSVQHEYELVGIGREHATYNHRLSDPELIERYANDFAFDASTYYEAK